MGTKKKNVPVTKYEKILANVNMMLAGIHFSPKEINDAFSKEVFKKHLASLDYDKNIFIQSDIKQLKLYETSLDEELKGAPVKFVPAAAQIFATRVAEAELIVKDILSKPFDFTTEESFITDGDKRDFPKSEAERKDTWRKRLKFMTLERYAEALEAREKNKGKEGFTVKTDAQLEKEARERVAKLVNRSFDRYRNKFKEEDQFNSFVNSITSTMDPHTNFFPPVEKRYFDEQLSHKFSGIGASLREEDGNIKIASLVTGSPAWKSGQIGVGDAIIKVAQGDKEPVDLTGYATEDAVLLIRGTKGSEVRLTLRKVDGSVKVVSLIRDEIMNDDRAAFSYVVDNGNGKVGYINLPEFYADVENPRGPHCSSDVAREVNKLKAEGVQGIVIDLRNNGGGYLNEVVQMAGLFIEEGPIVQVKDKDGKPSLWRDRDRSVIYDGPLVVMVNEFSASASEIFAAAMQDYKRGIVVGSSTTFGKGTVQRSFGIDGENFTNASVGNLGSLKVTMQKYYRINGGSVQLKGVSSDIVIPDLYEYSKLREKDDQDALPWDEIQKVDYRVWKSGNAFDAKALRDNSASRVTNNPAFNLIKTNTQWLSEQDDKTYSLKLDKYQAEKNKVNATLKQLESLNKLPKETVVSISAADQVGLSQDKNKEQRMQARSTLLKNDLYLSEALHVVADMVGQNNLAKN
jgi:carboxyl-terminal processing protease